MLAEEVILKPVITEKSAYNQTAGKYTFKVNTKATKVQIAKAVEELFNVKVLKVNTLNYDGKRKRVRGIVGKTAKYKKAVVTIDLDPQEVAYKDKGGKAKKTIRKYKNEIEGLVG